MTQQEHIAISPFLYLRIPPYLLLTHFGHSDNTSCGHYSHFTPLSYHTYRRCSSPPHRQGDFPSSPDHPQLCRHGAAIKLVSLFIVSTPHRSNASFTDTHVPLQLCHYCNYINHQHPTCPTDAKINPLKIWHHLLCRHLNSFPSCVPTSLHFALYTQNRKPRPGKDLSYLKRK